MSRNESPLFFPVKNITEIPPPITPGRNLTREQLDALNLSDSAPFTWTLIDGAFAVVNKLGPVIKKIPPDNGNS